MWNFRHSSNICYLKDFVKDQESFKRRLKQAKPVMKIKPPYKKNKNIKGYSYDKYKTNYDNKVLYKITKEISNRKGDYNQYILRPNSAFSGIRNSNFDRYLKMEKRAVDEDNDKIMRRIRNTKPVYSVEKMRKDAYKNQKYREFTLEILRKNRLTPLFNDEMENILNV